MKIFNTMTVAGETEVCEVEFRQPVLTLRVGRNVEDYGIVENPSFGGVRAFELWRSDGYVYRCDISEDSRRHKCDCSRFAATGACRHLAAVVSSIHAGCLPDPRERPDSPATRAELAGVSLPF